MCTFEVNIPKPYTVGLDIINILSPGIIVDPKYSIGIYLLPAEDTFGIAT
jgi:hypothetical protein